MNGILYGLSYGDNGRELLALDLEDAGVEVIELDTDNEVNGLTPFSEGKLLLVTTRYGESV